MADTDSNRPTSGQLVQFNGQWYMMPANNSPFNNTQNSLMLAGMRQPWQRPEYALRQIDSGAWTPFSNMLSPQAQAPARPMTPVTPFSWGGAVGQAGGSAGASQGAIPPMSVPQVRQGAPMAGNWGAQKIQGLQSGSATSGPFRQVFGGRQP